MRLIHTRTRNQRRTSTPAIAVSQAEITADLHYRGSAESRRDNAPARRGRR